MKALILIVEDNKTMIKLLKIAIKERFKEADIKAISFKNAPEFVKRNLPDLIILDLYDEGVDQEPAAGPTWKVVWNDHFCPIVIHSAKDEAFYRDSVHPYVRYEVKSRTSVGKVIGHIDGFEKQIKRFREMRGELIKRTGEALQATSTLLAKKDKLSPEQEEIVVRSARRRVAASFDDVDKQEYGWERYVFPPLSTDLLMGDIIHLRGQPTTDPNNFRVVLTPSCDLATGPTRTPVAEVLVASCRPFADFKVKANLQGLNPAKLRDRLPKELSRDQVGGLAALPGLGEQFPSMCADVRKLCLVPLTDIGLKPADEKTFFRVASMDSPFREKLMWAFVQIAGRPATPDLDPKNWLDEIVGSAVPAAAAPAAQAARN